MEKKTQRISPKRKRCEEIHVCEHLEKQRKDIETSEGRAIPKKKDQALVD